MSEFPGSVHRRRPHLLRARRGSGLHVSVDALRLHAVRDRESRPREGTRCAPRGDRPRPCDGYERRSAWTFNRRGAPAYTPMTRRRFLGMGAGSLRSRGATSTSTTSGSPPTPTRSSTIGCRWRGGSTWARGRRGLRHLLAGVRGRDRPALPRAVLRSDRGRDGRTALAPLALAGLLRKVPHGTG